jgi:PKD repeat protein
MAGLRRHLRMNRHATPAVACLVACLGLLALAVSAGPAAAVLARIGAHTYGVTPVRGANLARLPAAERALPATARSRSAPLRYDKAGQLVSHGGPVMHSVTAHLVYWDPHSEFTATTTGIFSKFFADVAQESGSPTNVFAVAGQYTDSTGHAAYSSTFAVAKLDKDPYPSTGTCTTPKGAFADPGPYSKCLFDEQLQAELASYIEKEALPTGPTQLYVLLLPHKVVSCFPEKDPEIEEEACSNNVFCAYHSSFGGPSEEVIYATIPFSLLDSEDAKGCQADGHSVIQLPNGDATGTNETTRFADVALKYTSHEYIEAATDPFGDGWWENAHGQEIGDKCNFAGSGLNPGEDPNAFLPTLGGTSSSGTLFNQSINSHHFYLQSEWDNVGAACLMKPLELTEPSFTALPEEGTAGEPVTFEGLVEDPYEEPEFTWDFGDGTEGTGELAEHTYAAPGAYKVTMTARDALTGATTLPATQTFTVDEIPSAAFTFEPAKPTEGGAVKFDAEGSEDPDGSITEYAWDFGDGTEGSGEKPEHAYANPGLYTVKLTVTDSSAQEASVSHQVAVGGHPVVKTEPAAPVSSTSATLNAKVNPDGLNVTECKFEYGATTEYGSEVPCSALPGSGTSDVAVSAVLSGLAPSTTLHYRIVAENSGGEAEGADATVTTVVRPTVTTGSASSVTAGSAALGGSVNPNGVNVSECKFEYGPTVAYGSSAACGSPPGSASSSVGVSAAVPGLSASTTYHYRLVAANAGGAVQGEDRTFTTLMSIAKEPLAPPPVLTPPVLTPPAPGPVASPAPNGTFTLAASANPKTGAITVTVGVGDPGTLTWLATFQNGKFGVFAASAAKCRKGLVRLGGKCRPAKIVFAKGHVSVAGAGKVTVVLKPSASALKALRNALKKKKSVPVSVLLSFQSSRGGSPVSHNVLVTVKLKKH